MFLNLIEATKEYWRKLDTLEEAYQRGDISLKEVDMRVAELMTELGQKRRLAIILTLQSVQHWIVDRKETVLGIVIVSLVAYIWTLNILMF